MTVEQAICETAGRLGTERIQDVIEAAIIAERTSPSALLARAAALVPNPPRGLADVVVLADALARTDDVPASVLEALLFRILRDPRIPEWTAQATPPWWHHSDERVDVLVPAWRLIIEADGRRWHTRRRDFEHDRRRDQAALVHGHVTVRFTHHQLEREPAHVLDVLLRIGRHAAA